MNQRLYILFSLVFFSFSSSILAQDSIVDDLNKPKAGQGEVRIYQDESIKNLVGVRHEAQDQTTAQDSSTDSKTGTKVASSGETRKVRGFKIQVFSGNDPKKSRSEANYKQSQVKARFPQMSVEIRYDSPFWRVRAGNYSNRADAEEALRSLKAAFPAFGREMYVVQDVVRVGQ